MNDTTTTRELPKGWRWVKLGEVLKEARNGLYKPDTFYGRGTRILKMFNIGRLDGTWNLDAVDLLELTESELGFYRLESGDILLNRVNSRELVGKCAVVDDRTQGAVFESKNIRVRVDLAQVVPEWAAAWLNSVGGRLQIDSRLKQIVGQATVNRSDLNSLAIPLPPLAEQRRIAGVLRDQMGAVARARAALAAQLAAAEALPAAHLRAVFQSPQAQRWPKKRLGEVAEITGGIQKTPDRAPVKLHKAFLTVRNVQHGALDLSVVERFEVTPKEFERCRLHTGDLLIVEGNGSKDHIGRNAVFQEDGEWIHQNHIIRVRLPAEAFSPDFASRFLSSDEGRALMLEKAQTTTGLYTLSTGKVASLEIPAPPLPEQSAIAARLATDLAAVTRLRLALGDQLVAVERLPAALLRRAFAGEV